MAMAVASCALFSTGNVLRNRFCRIAASGADGDGSNVATKGEEAKMSFQSKSYQVAEGMRLTVLSASLPVPLRLGSGGLVQGYKASLVSKETVPPTQYSVDFAGRKLVETGEVGPRPAQPIQLYEFEGCPFCRKVREVTSILDLDILYYPCPQNGPTYRPKAIELGGKKQFPYMVDPNTGIAMYESDNIIKYLVERYGNGKVPLALSLGPLTTLTAGLALLARAGKGSKYVPSKKPEKPLDVWAYEASPFCKIVRERLVELELPHIIHNCARGSRRRNELLERTGIFQVPYLEDPNTSKSMFESSDIINYLNATYALAA